MTAVIAYSVHGFTYLVADTLLSLEGGSDPPAPQELSTGQLIDVEKQTDVQFVEGGLKLGRVNDRLAVGYAGHVEAGNYALHTLAAEQVCSFDDLSRLILEKLIPWSIDNGSDLSLCGFYLHDQEAIKFATSLAETGDVELLSSSDPDLMYIIGSGGLDLKNSILPFPGITHRAEDAALTGRVGVQSRIQLRQILGDEEMLKYHYGGALVGIYSDGHQISWQPSFTQIAYFRKRGFRHETEMVVLPHICKSIVHDDRFWLFFARLDGGGCIVNIRLVENCLSGRNPSGVRSHDLGDTSARVFAISRSNGVCPSRAPCGRW